jgi:hypothetical protein
VLLQHVLREAVFTLFAPLPPEKADMSSHTPIIRRLYELDRASPGFSSEIFAIFREETIRDHTSKLSAQDALWLVGYLDDVGLILQRLNPNV